MRILVINFQAAFHERPQFNGCCIVRAVNVGMIQKVSVAIHLYREQQRIGKCQFQVKSSQYLFGLTDLLSITQTAVTSGCRCGTDKVHTTLTKFREKRIVDWDLNGQTLRMDKLSFVQ